MELTTQVQILEKAICVSLCAKAFGKGMNPFVPPSYLKIVKQTGLFSLSEATS